MNPIKIMYLNPVGTSHYDQFFADLFQAHKYPNTEVHVTSLNPAVGPITNLEYRTYEAIVTADIIRATHQAAQEGFDALVIGCFYDTALHDAREISGDMIVIAPCHASIEIALHIANNFSVIVGQRKWVNQMKNTIRGYGYGDKLMSFHDVGINVVEFQQDHNFIQKQLIAAAHKAVTDDYAESLILGCTLETGFYQELEAELGVPVIDPTLASFKAAEHAALLKRDFGWKPSRKWSCQAPPTHETAAFALFQESYQFGKRVIVPNG
ncbi:MAG: aspartate/glutamate racemase family protein [Chloroflexales bacterium]|nr:aspartate/glutamate racemase family protein [Chloroflexales bacterium]